MELKTKHNFHDVTAAELMAGHSDERRDHFWVTTMSGGSTDVVLHFRDREEFRKFVNHCAMTLNSAPVAEEATA